MCEVVYVQTKTPPQDNQNNETVIFLPRALINSTVSALTVSGMEIQELIIRSQRFSTKEGTGIQQCIIKVLIHKIERSTTR